VNKSRRRREQAEGARPGRLFQTLVGQNQLSILVEVRPVLRQTGDAAEGGRGGGRGRRGGGGVGGGGGTT